MPETEQEPDDDTLAEHLANRLEELLMNPGTDPMTRRVISNKLRESEGLEAMPYHIGRELLAAHLGTSVRQIRNTEAIGLEKIRRVITAHLRSQPQP